MRSRRETGIFTASCLALALLGCEGQIRAVKQVNEAAMFAVSPSHSDKASRLMAMKTLEGIADRSRDYLAGPEDLLEVSIFEWELREETKTATFRISESGSISLPVVGSLSVGGRTVGEIRQRIEQKLQEGGFIQQPRVSVTIKEYRSKKVAVVGSVKDPGVYTLRQNVTTLLDMLTLAGGVNDRAGYLAHVIQPGRETPARKDGKKTVTIDLFELMQQGDMTLNMVLRNGDVLHVPEAQNYSVIGYVGKPGNYPLKVPTTVLAGVAAAGGVDVKDGDPENCLLKRRLIKGTAVIPLNLVSIIDGQKPNWYLKPGDVLEVQEDTDRKTMLGLVDFLKNILNIGFVFN